MPLRCLEVFIMRHVLFAVLLLTLPLAACKKEQDADNANTVKIVAVTAAGAKHVIHAEIADNDQTRTQGLMFRTEMPEDHGMLFIFPAEQPLGFWMRNTLIPLDMVFVRGDGFINHIHPDAKPQDETVIMSKGPVSRVLELNGGTAARLGLKEGDRLFNDVYFGK